MTADTEKKSSSLSAARQRAQVEAEERAAKGALKRLLERVTSGTIEPALLEETPLQGVEDLVAGFIRLGLEEAATIGLPGESPERQFKPWPEPEERKPRPKGERPADRLVFAVGAEGPPVVLAFVGPGVSYWESEMGVADDFADYRCEPGIWVLEVAVHTSGSSLVGDYDEELVVTSQRPARADEVAALARNDDPWDEDDWYLAEPLVPLEEVR